MAAKVDIKRGVKSRQLKALDLHVEFDGTGAVGVKAALGPDAQFVSQIDKIAVGQYRIIFNYGFEQVLFPLSFTTAEGLPVKVVALGNDRITFTTVDDAGLDADSAAIYASVRCFDHRFFN